MLFAIESIVLCAIFALLIIPRTRKNPLWQLSSYPPAIIERVRSLPQYEGKLPSEQKGYVRKIFGAFLFVIALAVVVYYSGAITWGYAFWYSLGLWMAVNWFDVFIMDCLLFCHDKVYRLPGTEDMVDEYENYWFHIRGGFKGCVIGLAVSIIVATVVYLFGVIF